MNSMDRGSGFGRTLPCVAEGGRRMWLFSFDAGERDQ